MSSDDETAAGEDEVPAADAEGPGVLGSLPRSRPSVRSPRRAEAVRKQDPPPAQREPSQPESAGSSETAPPQPGAGPEADLERLARAGLSVAGGAAALGLRAAGRAAAALRDAVERR